jgi:cysteinyl-tRNA synthetase
VLFDLVRAQNRERTHVREAQALVADILTTFRLDADPIAQLPDAEVTALLRERDELRRTGRFDAADRIRDDLAAKGIVLEDSPTGVRWRVSSP